MPDESTNNDAITIEQVSEVVSTSETNILNRMDSASSDLSANIVSLADSVTLLANANNEANDTDTVYTVKLDSGQVETAKVAVSVACTEGLVICILLAVLCGLQCWRIISGGWSTRA